MALTKVPSNLDATVATTQSASDNSTNVATTAYVTTAIANLVDGAPSTLNTLDEIAAALNDDAALNTTLTNSIATKASLTGSNTTAAAFNAGTANVVASFTSTDSVGAIQLADNAGNVELSAVGNDFHIQNAGAAAKMVVLNSGNVGIGTDSPDANLEVRTNQSMSFNSDTVDSITIGTSGTNKPCIKFDTADTTHTNRVWAIENGAGNRLNFFRNGLDVLKLNQDGSIEIPGDDVLIGSATNLNVLSGTPKIQVGDGSNHSSMQFYSGTSSVAGLYFGDASSGGGRYSGYIEYRHNNNSMAFRANDGDRLVVDQNGNVVIGGGTTPRTMGFGDTRTQIEGTGATTASLSIVRNSNGVNPPYLIFGKSRGTALGANTIVANGDYLGTIRFNAADGTDAGNSAAQIHAQIDGTPGANDTPGSLYFSTTNDGENAATSRMVIKSDGKVGIGTNSPGAKLEVSGKDDYGSSDIIKCIFDNSPADTGVTFADIFGTVKSRFSIDASNTNDLYISSGTEMKFFLGTTTTSSTQVLHLKKINSNISSVHVGNGVIGPSNDITYRAQGSGENWRWGSNVANSHSYWINSSSTGVYMTSGSTAWSAHSDERLKENITPIGEVLPSLLNMRCVKYNRKGDSGNTKIGFIAQDWEGKGFDEVVDEDTGFTIQDDGTLESVVEEDNTSTLKPKSIAYTETIPLLLKAIQELEARVKELES